MTNLFIVNSPLQYLLARTIAETFFADEENCLLQYFDSGDFSAVFAAIDELLGENRFFSHTIYKSDISACGHEFSRAFFSNRFNKSENEILDQLKCRTKHICAFEDGISLYLGHYFLDSRIRDNNRLIQIKKLVRRPFLAAGLIQPSPIEGFFPLRTFSEVYSVFPDVPGLRAGTRRISIAEAFRSMCGDCDRSISDSCLLLSQSLVVDGLVEDTEYCDFLKRRIGELRNRYGTVYYKRHPREAADYIDVFEAFGCEPLPDRYALAPVELFIAAHPGIDIYGFWSTTLIYSSVIDSTPFSFGSSLISETTENQKLRESWTFHEPILRRFGVTEY